MLATTIVALQFARWSLILFLLPLPLLVLLLIALDGIYVSSIGTPLNLRIAPLSIFVLFMAFVPLFILRPCLWLTGGTEHFHP